MKFKLINRQTNEEHICVEIVENGFTYYLTNVLEVTDGYILNLTRIEKYSKDDRKYEKYHKVIATNNPNIDIPKVIDKITEVFKNHFDIDSTEDFPKTVGDTNIIEYFKEGYNKSQQDFPFNEEDMIEFGDWLINVCNSDWELNKNCYITGVASITIRNTKELFDIWKSQQIKTIYYE
jgi:hypothetical protein